MPRLDVRIKTDLLATVVLFRTPECSEKTVHVTEMSLSSGLITGMVAAPKTQFAIRIKLPKNVEIEFAGELARNRGNGSVVSFFFPDKQALSALWDYLRGISIGQILQDACPYCGDSRSGQGDSCRVCGHYLVFTDENYLDKHLRATFSERVRTRLNKLDSGFVRRHLALMDSQIMNLPLESSEEEFVGTASCVLRVFSMIRRAAATDMNILVLGESGTGKELTARAIHEKSLRKNKPFIVVNCAAIPEGLLEAELFGYEKGSFTGAYQTKKGRFELADGGSIFLDEIGDLSLGLQAKLLRFLEDHTIERVGCRSGTKVDIRIIAATNCDLETMALNGSFRKDLYFRLNSFTIKLPPLRERGDDKIVLAKYFFRKFHEEEQSSLQGFSDSCLKAIRDYTWPGNVRELVNKVRRGLVMAAGEYIEAVDLELDQNQKHAPVTAVPRDNQRKKIYQVLEQNGFVVAHAAKALQVSRPTMYSLIKKFEIDLPNMKHHPEDLSSVFK